LQKQGLKNRVLLTLTLTLKKTGQIQPCFIAIEIKKKHTATPRFSGKEKNSEKIQKALQNLPF
jgi:hypothetical protein